MAELLALQRVAYAVEARLIGFDGIPPLHETAEELRACGEYFLGVRSTDALLGAVSWQREADGVLDICRLVVAPTAHRGGVATALLDALDALERPHRTVVSTGTANGPARALYRRRGFAETATVEIAPGVTITELERRVVSAPPVTGG